MITQEQLDQDKAAVDAAQAKLTADQAAFDAVQPHLSVLGEIEAFIGAHFGNIGVTVPDEFSTLIAKARSLF